MEEKDSSLLATKKVTTTLQESSEQIIRQIQGTKEILTNETKGETKIRRRRKAQARKPEGSASPARATAGLSIPHDGLPTISSVHSFKAGKTTSYPVLQQTEHLTDGRPWTALPTYFPPPPPPSNMMQHPSMRTGFAHPSQIVPIHIPRGYAPTASDGRVRYPYAYYPTMPYQHERYPVQFMFYPVKIPVNAVRPMMADELSKEGSDATTATDTGDQDTDNPADKFESPENTKSGEVEHLPQIDLESVKSITSTGEEPIKSREQIPVVEIHPRYSLKTSPTKPPSAEKLKTIAEDFNKASSLLRDQSSPSRPPDVIVCSNEDSNVPMYSPSKTLTEEISMRFAMHPREALLVKKRKQLSGIVDRVTKVASKKNHKVIHEQVEELESSSKSSHIPSGPDDMCNDEIDTGCSIKLNKENSENEKPITIPVLHPRFSVSPETEKEEQEEDLSSLDKIRDILNHPIASMDREPGSLSTFPITTLPSTNFSSSVGSSSSLSSSTFSTMTLCSSVLNLVTLSSSTLSSSILPSSTLSSSMLPSSTLSSSVLPSSTISSSTSSNTLPSKNPSSNTLSLYELPSSPLSFYYTLPTNTVPSCTASPNTVSRCTASPNTVPSCTTSPNAMSSCTASPNTVSRCTASANTVSSCTASPNTVSMCTASPNTVSRCTASPNTVSRCTASPNTVSSCTASPNTTSSCTSSSIAMSSSTMSSITLSSSTLFNNSVEKSYAEKQKLIQDNTSPHPRKILQNNELSINSGERKTPEPTAYEQKLIAVVNSSINSLSTIHRSNGSRLQPTNNRNNCNTLEVRPRTQCTNDRYFNTLAGHESTESTLCYSDTTHMDSESEEYHALKEISILQSANNPMHDSFHKSGPLFNNITLDETDSQNHEHCTRNFFIDDGSKPLFNPIMLTNCYSDDYRDLPAYNPRVVLEDIRTMRQLKHVLMELRQKPEYEHIYFDIESPGGGEGRKRTKRNLKRFADIPERRERIKRIKVAVFYKESRTNFV